MDFGVPQQQQQRRRSSGLSSLIHYGEAMQRLADSASESNHSELSQVCKDNDGFLGWDLDRLWVERFYRFRFKGRPGIALGRFLASKDGFGSPVWG